MHPNGKRPAASRDDPRPDPTERDQSEREDGSPRHPTERDPNATARRDEQNRPNGRGQPEERTPLGIPNRNCRATSRLKSRNDPPASPERRYAASRSTTRTPDRHRRPGPNPANPIDRQAPANSTNQHHWASDRNWTCLRRNERDRLLPRDRPYLRLREDH
jgi:hypothetical protein